MRTFAAIVVAVALTASSALAQPPTPASYTLLDTISESLFGDVYAEPSKWQPLSAGTFFSEGWNRPWASPPPGRGGAPRQGWLNAFDGVFYRLGVATFGFAEDFHDNGNQYSGGFTLYAPFSARFEVRLDVPFIVSNRAGSDNDYSTNFGDLQLTPRFLISESHDFTQSFNATFRVPTGSEKNGNDFAAVTPTWSSGGTRGRSSSCVEARASRFPTPRAIEPARSSSRTSPPATTSRRTTSRRSAISSSTCPATSDSRSTAGRRTPSSH